MSKDDFTPIQKTAMVEFFKTELNTIQEKKQELIAKEKEYADLITKFSNGIDKIAQNQLRIVGEPKTTSGYNPSWAWPTRAKFILEEESQALTTREVLNKVFAYEPNLNATKDTARSALASLSATLSVGCLTGRDFKRFTEHKDAPYRIGLSEWFKEDGSIKDQYK